MKFDKFYIKIVGVIIVAITSIMYLRMFDNYLHPYIEGKVFSILTPIIIFFLLMKLIGFAGLRDMEGKNIFQLFIHLCYEFRYGLAVLIFFFGAFNPFEKELSFAKVLNEYYGANIATETVTVYQIHDNIIYDHENKIYRFYNQNLNIETNNTYEISYYQDSRIISNLKGPLNSQKQEHENKVQILSTKYNNGSVTIKWKPYYDEGIQIQQYRVEGYVKQDDGTLLRSGSQIIVYDRETTTTISNLVKNKEYQFVVKPLIGKKYDSKHQGTSEFISTSIE